MPGCSIEKISRIREYRIEETREEEQDIATSSLVQGETVEVLWRLFTSVAYGRKHITWQRRWLVA